MASSDLTRDVVSLTNTLTVIQTQIQALDEALAFMMSHATMTVSLPGSGLLAADGNPQQRSLQGSALDFFRIVQRYGKRRLAELTPAELADAIECASRAHPGGSDGGPGSAGSV